MFYLYILQSERTRRYYIGSTENIARRLREHNGELPSLSRTTLAGRPWKLIF